MACLVIVVSLSALYLPSMAAHVRNAANVRYLNDDAQQQLWPFLRYRDPSLFKNDYLADYQLAMNPIGFGGLYRLSAPTIDPRLLGKVVPYLLLLVTFVAVGRVSWRLGGPPAAWGSLALCLSTEVFLFQTAGGLPRAFGFPLVALAAWALVAGRPYGLAVVTWLGAAFYYPVGVLGGMILMIYLFVPPSWTGATPWSVKRRLTLAAGTGLLSLSIMLPSLIVMRPYGPVVGPRDWGAFEEAGDHGRLGAFDVVRTTPIVDVLRAGDYWVTASLTSADAPWTRPTRAFGERHAGAIRLGVVLLLVLAYAGIVVRGDMAARRLLILPMASLATYLVAWMAVPYLYVPERYLKFAIPLSLVTMIPAAAAGGSVCAGARCRRALSVVAFGVVAVLLLVLGGRGSRDAGLTVKIPEERMPLHRFLASLPADALIAGWPQEMDDVPYATARRVLLTWELHLPFHRAYLIETRRRMEALMAAYFATTPAPLSDLRREFGVTHLVVDLRHFGPEPPSYFAPFDRDLRMLRTRMGDNSEVLREIGHAGVFQTGRYAVLDLRRVASGPDGRHSN